MRSHAKALSAGLTSSRGHGLGSIHLVLAICSLLALALLVPVANAAPGAKGVVSWIGTSSEGSLGGQFSGPAGVAVNNTSGDVYAVDRFNSRIQQFSSAGAFIRAWGFDVIKPGKPGDLGNSVFEVCTVAADCKAGISSVSPAPGGQLSNPRGIAIDQSDGSVYVSEQGFRRVQKFSSTGAFQLAFGKDVDSGGGTATEACPTAATCKAGVSGSLGGEFGSTFFGFSGYLAVAPAGAPNAGNVVVADGDNRRVQEFTPAGAFVRAIGFDIAGAGAGADNTGIGFEVCTQAVAGAANCQAGTVGSGIGQFANGQPTRVAVDTTGAIYTVESESNNRVQKFTPQAGPPPLAPSVFAEALLSGFPGPTDVAIDFSNNHAYVTKPANSPSDRQVRQLDSSGALQFTHGAGSGLTNSAGLAVKAGDASIYQSSTTGGQRVYILDNLTPPTAELDTPAVDAITSTSAMLHGKVNPNGAPDVSYRFEYSLNGTDWTPASAPDTVLGSQVTTQSVSKLLKPGIGLEPNTLYHVRVVATRPFNPSVISASTTFKTLSQAPIAETTGSPIRTATTAQLNGRFVAFNAPASYHFEYGLTEAYGQSTPTQPGGSSGVYQLVTKEVTGLEPDTTYHYRLVADNGAPGSPVFGEDMTVTTRVTDAPLSHGDFPGPPGSDRAWEQVNAPDLSGNSVSSGLSFSDNGDRAVYSVSGGTPDSNVGSFISAFLVEREADGWKIHPSEFPPRDQLVGGGYRAPAGPTDLSSLFLVNADTAGSFKMNYWRVTPGSPPVRLFNPVLPQEPGFWFAGSEHSTRAVASIKGGGIDPDYPVAGNGYGIYDVSSESNPELVSLLPDGTPAPCVIGSGIYSNGEENGVGRFGDVNWITPDGNFAFFPSPGPSFKGSGGPFGCNSFPPTAQLYARDIAADETRVISLLPGEVTLSGPKCGGALLQSNDDAAFFYTQSRLVSEDSAPPSCSTSFEAPPDGDVYRYDLGDETLDCVTCVIPGLDTDVEVHVSESTAVSEIAVAPDGSRVYFQSQRRLTPGASEGASNGNAYVVEVDTGEIRWLGQGIKTGDRLDTSGHISHDGSVLVFRSAHPYLNVIGGQQNGGTAQYYRYDDRDRSLICLSCPQDGSIPHAAVNLSLMGNFGGTDGNNITPIGGAGGDVAFPTPTALLPTDQNTGASGQSPKVGDDIYEWRDGRLLLITDGLTEWFPEKPPRLHGVSRSGDDVFFIAAARLTPDAPDAFVRLYTAHVNGGFEFPEPPSPCPLEVCQGTPKGAPDDPSPASGDFAGRGNVQERPQRKRCGKGRRKVRRAGKVRCVKRTTNRANHNRRTAR